jgi:hypothetical protein
MTDIQEISAQLLKYFDPWTFETGKKLGNFSLV